MLVTRGLVGRASRCPPLPTGPRPGLCSILPGTARGAQPPAPCPMGCGCSTGRLHRLPPPTEGLEVPGSPKPLVLPDRPGRAGCWGEGLGLPACALGELHGGSSTGAISALARAEPCSWPRPRGCEGKAWVWRPSRTPLTRASDSDIHWGHRGRAGLVSSHSLPPGPGIRQAGPESRAVWGSGGCRWHWQGREGVLSAPSSSCFNSPCCNRGKSNLKKGPLLPPRFHDILNFQGWWEE